MVELIAKFRDCPILVIGDVMLDEFIWGQVNRISPEAPVPVVEVRRRSITVGGSETATVALQRTHAVGVNESIAIGAAQ